MDGFRPPGRLAGGTTFPGVWLATQLTPRVDQLAAVIQQLTLGGRAAQPLMLEGTGQTRTRVFFLSLAWIVATGAAFGLGALEVLAGWRPMWAAGWLAVGRAAALGAIGLLVAAVAGAILVERG